VGGGCGGGVRGRVWGDWRDEREGGGVCGGAGGGGENVHGRLWGGGLRKGGRLR